MLIIQQDTTFSVDAKKRLLHDLLKKGRVQCLDWVFVEEEEPKSRFGALELGALWFLNNESFFGSFLIFLCGVRDV